MSHVNGEKRYEVDTDGPVGYKCRWSQQGFAGTVTGDVVYRDLDECLDLCRRFNKKWQGQVKQWPVRFTLNGTGVALGELGDHQHLVERSLTPELKPAQQPVLVG